MSLDAYRLVTQLGAGRDGASYRAEAVSDGTPVEVGLLALSPADPDRRRRLARRLRVAALVEHPVARRVVEVNLESDAPFVALEALPGTTLADVLHDRAPLAPADALALATDLVGAVAAAHRQGLSHGGLAPTHVYTAGGRGPKIDFVCLDLRAAPDGDRFGELDATFRPPEPVDADHPDAAADIYALGALLVWLFTGRPLSPGWEGDPSLTPDRQRLLAEMLARDPADRPSLARCLERLQPPRAPLDATGVFGGPTSPGVTVAGTIVASPSEDEAMPAERLGRYQLLEKLGQGGMGAVFRACDPADGSIVAIKVLRAHHVNRPDLLRRFHKEARLLAEVNNPHVANLLEVNEDAGVHYLVMEFVAGQSLGQLLKARGRLDERTALAILADVCRALVEAHRRGIVHRDIKPDNILLQIADCRLQIADLSEQLAIGNWQSAMVRLTDFGLARHVVESESMNVTQAGAILGTPRYMAPEQFAGGAVDARADVYALGVTLFHMLAGRPPFEADDLLKLMAMHRTEAPESLTKLDPPVSEGAARVVEKALAKEPEARHADAAALLRDLERLLRGEPASIDVHPRLPECDPARVIRFDWEWHLEASPRQLWPHVANTERLNRAVGLPAVQFTAEPDPAGGTRRFGRFRKAGVIADWQEHPFEWVEGRRFGVLREYRQGPFQWLMSLVELTPRPGGGTTLAHRVRLRPNGLLGRTVAAIEVGFKGRRAVERVYRRIDAAVTGKLGNPALADPFESPAPLSGARRRRLEEFLDRLTARGIDPALVERLGDFLAEAPAQEVARIRPLALAGRLGVEAEPLVAACLHGARDGLLVLLWDILCPICRIPSQVQETLRALRDHGHCPACNLDFDLDFANSVEMIFRVHPELRDVEVGTYCIGGPAHFPHVVAQARLAPGERLELELALAEGVYRLRGPQLPWTLDLRVQPSATTAHGELNLVRPPDAGPALRPGSQVLALTNDHDREVVVRIERTAPRGDALTAARASSLALFRELFPTETLQPGQLVRVATVTFLVTELAHAGDLYAELGDSRAFALVHEHFRLLEEHIRSEGGAVVKTVGEGVLAAFGETAAAVRAALGLPGRLAQGEATRGLRLRLGVHRGSAMAATLNDHLDYFGTCVKQAVELPRLAGGGEVVLTASVCADPAVAALLASRGLRSEVLTADLPGAPGAVLQRICLLL